MDFDGGNQSAIKSMIKSALVSADYELQISMDKNLQPNLRQICSYGSATCERNLKELPDFWQFLFIKISSPKNKSMKIFIPGEPIVRSISSVGEVFNCPAAPPQATYSITWCPLKSIGCLCNIRMSWVLQKGDLLVPPAPDTGWGVLAVTPDPYFSQAIIPMERPLYLVIFNYFLY